MQLPDSEAYVWHIRAYHSDFEWVGVGDSLDLVLLRDRCGVPVGHGMRGCYSEEDSSVVADWSVHSKIADVRSLPRGRWIFGPGSAGARLFGRSLGTAVVTARVPAGLVSVPVRVVAGFDRLRVEPRDSVFFVGDTIWFQVEGLDRSGAVVAHLPWPLTFGQQVAKARADGAIPIVFETPTGEGGPLGPTVFNVGSKADTLTFRLVAH